LPYVWKINEAIFWGKKKVEEMWKKSLASIYGFFWSAYRYMINQIPRQITIIKSIPNSLFKLFFGKKSLQTLVSVDYQR
jgi:recombinational DNA repair protein RecT